MSSRTSQHPPRHGGTFWAFVFGVAFGAALGAVLMHKYLAEQIPSPPPEVEAPLERPDSAPESDPVQRVLRDWRLTPEDIRRQLDRAGQVIRREGAAVTEKLDAATLDARIVASIQAKYALDAHLPARAIAVKSDDGHVTLSGTVASPELEVRAVVLALDTRGVVDVVSQLHISTPAPPPATGG